MRELTQKMGTALLLFQLENYKDWDVEPSNDKHGFLIATNRNSSQKYAILVRTRNHEKDGHSCSSFTYEDAKKLRDFAGNNLIPMIAYVIVKADKTICTFLIKLDDLDAMQDESIIIKESEDKKHYLFVYGNQNHPSKVTTDSGKIKNLEHDHDIFEKVLKEERILHIVMSADSNL